MLGMLYGVGVVAFVVGAAMVGFGLPVHEFSFGNTLIIAGSTAAVGGLVVIGLGAVVAQLQRIHEALATRAPIKSSRPFDTFENTVGSRNAPAPGRIPFPPRPRTEAGIHEPPLFAPLPQSFAPPLETAAAPDRHADEPQAATSIAPTLRNPEEQPPVTLEDEVSLLPPHPMAPGSREAVESSLHEHRSEPKFDADWHSPPPAPARQPQSNYFDAMWPAEPKQAKEPPREPSTSPVGSETQYEATATQDHQVEQEAPLPPPASEPRGVAILKSGVVDGMGYTLYVDGSIEAELPQGTLRFSSINELRSHLEKNS